MKHIPGSVFRELPIIDQHRLEQAYAGQPPLSREPHRRANTRKPNRDSPECGAGMGFAVKGDWVQCVYYSQHPENEAKGKAPHLKVGQFYLIKDIGHSVWLNAQNQVDRAHCRLWIHREDGKPAMYTDRNFRFAVPEGRTERAPERVTPHTPYVPRRPLIMLHMHEPAPAPEPPKPIILEPFILGHRKITLD